MTQPDQLAQAVRQAALGQPRPGSPDSRWDFRTVEIGYVCAVYHRLRAARVRLLNHPSLEFDEVPIARDINVLIGDQVFVEWLGGHQNNPVIVGLADHDTKERSQSTMRPIVDLVPLPKNPDASRHVVEHRLLALKPTPLVSDAYAGLVNWEAHADDGRYIQVFAQQMPSPAESNANVPDQFARLYHQFEVSPVDGVVYRQIPTADGGSAWRMTSRVVGSQLEVTFEFGGYAGGVQDWSGNGNAVTLTIANDGSINVDAARISFRGGTRPILVSDGGAVPAGVVPVEEVTA